MYNKKQFGYSVISSILAIVFTSQAMPQRAFRGFYATSYIIADANSDKERKVNGNISIVYDDSYCLFSVDGRPPSFFPTRSFEKRLIGEYIHTDFISRETGIAPDGRYGIMVDEGENGKMFQIIVGNTTYLAEKTTGFSEDGKVPSSVYIKNWKELTERKKRDDSTNVLLSKQREDQLLNDHYQDSLNYIKDDSFAVAEKISKLEKGDNLNTSNFMWLSNSVRTSVKTDVYFFADFKLLIDKYGIITSATPVKTLNATQLKYVQAISNIIVGKKTTPWVYGGVNYPSYSTLSITLVPKNYFEN